MTTVTKSTIDNDIYSQIADTWWTEDSVLCLLRHHLNPCRFDYFQEILSKRLKKSLSECRVLDIGCGGGFLTEEFAKLGCQVVGIDPSVQSIEVAHAHAMKSGLKIDYREGYAEQLPLDDESFDVVCCCDVLEHVKSVADVIAETKRVLRRDGVYCFDTVNRTFISWLFYIKIAQDWDITSYIPPNLHDWNMFIRPQELRQVLASNGMIAREFVGMTPNVNPLRIIMDLTRRKRGDLTFSEFAARFKLIRTRSMPHSYMGYAERADLKTSE